MKTKGLLLDSHVLIWLINGSKQLQPKTRKLINQHANAGQVFIAAISVWEIAMLEAKNRIRLTLPCTEWINTVLDKSGIGLLPLSPSIAIDSSRLPGEIHGDPADRMIIATARKHQLTLITQDTLILQYSKSHFVDCHPA